jgi:hypothetical protein
LTQEAAFRTTDHGGRNFNKDKLVFGRDVPLPPEPAKPKRAASADPAEKKDPFRPSNPPKRVSNSSKFWVYVIGLQRDVE